MSNPPPVPPDDVPGISPMPVPSPPPLEPGPLPPPISIPVPEPGPSPVTPPLPPAFPPVPASGAGVSGPPALPAGADAGAPPPGSYPAWQGAPVMPQSSPGKSTKVLLFGCLGLVILAVLGIGAGVTWLYGKAKGIAANPEKFIAEMVVKDNPDLELVNVDRTSRQFTVRSKSSGETMTISIEDLEAGKMVFRKSDGTTAEIGAGGLQVTEKDGTRSVTGAGAAAAPLPDWLPGYPGPHQIMLSSRQDREGRGKGTLTFSTTDSVAAAAAVWQKALEDAGFTLTVTDLPEVQGKTLEGAAALAEGRGTITARLILQAGQTVGHVEYRQE